MSSQKKNIKANRIARWERYAKYMVSQAVKAYHLSLGEKRELKEKTIASLHKEFGPVKLGQKPKEAMNHIYDCIRQWLQNEGYLEKPNSKIVFIGPSASHIVAQRVQDQIDPRWSIEECQTYSQIWEHVWTAQGEEDQETLNQQRYVLYLRVVEEKTLEEIGDEWGISRERVRQIEMKGIWTIHRKWEQLDPKELSPEEKAEAERTIRETMERQRKAEEKKAELARRLAPILKKIADSSPESRLELDILRRWNKGESIQDISERTHLTPRKARIKAYLMGNKILGKVQEQDENLWLRLTRGIYHHERQEIIGMAFEILGKSYPPLPLAPAKGKGGPNP